MQRWRALAAAAAAALAGGCGATAVTGPFAPETVTSRQSPESNLSAPSDEWIDSHACPHPGTNRADPLGWDAHDLDLRRHMLAGLGNVQATLLLTPSFEPASLIAIGRKEPAALAACHDQLLKECPSEYELVLREADKNLWYAMTEQMLPHGNPPRVIMDDANMAQALEHVQLQVREVRVPLDTELATRLIGLWHGTLARTAYPAERLSVGFGSSDGEGAEFWVRPLKQGGTIFVMAGQTHSPNAGSYLADFVALGKQLRAVKASVNAEFWRELRVRLAQLEQRLQKAEPCVTKYVRSD